MPTTSEPPHSPADDARDGIRVTELPDENAHENGGILSAVLSAYFRQGHDAGYQCATRDIMASIMPMAEEFLREHPDSSAELRRFVYSFCDAVESHLSRLPSGASYVEGGLGI